MNSLHSMQGKGYYNQHSEWQQKTQIETLKLWTKALEQVSCTFANQNENFLIADLGCSQGANSLQPINQAITYLREKSSQPFPISICHTDLPSNDFSSLFTLLDQSPESYLKLHENVYASALGKSFFKRLFPENSLNLAYSSIALQWMSETPCEVPQALLGQVASPEIAEKFRLQSLKDWTHFLKNRSLEMKPGAQLVTSMPASTKSHHNNYKAFFEWAYPFLQQIKEEAYLNEQELNSIQLPIFYRSQEDLEAPFHQNDFDKTLKLEEIKIIPSPSPYWASFQQNQDAAQYAENFIGFFRAFSEPSFFELLSSEHRKKGADRFYQLLQEDLEKNPKPYLDQIPIAFLRISKNNT